METAEAAAVRTVREVVYLPIAKETASVSAALDDVKHLPPGSQYAEREGRATVTVVFRNDTVIARADCDSMEQRMEEYRELAIVMAGMMMRSSEQTEQAVTAEKKTMEGSVFKTGFIWFLIGVVVGVAGVFIIRR